VSGTRGGRKGKDDAIGWVSGEEKMGEGVPCEPALPAAELESRRRS
jgi:hypothetical protein